MPSLAMYFPKTADLVFSLLGIAVIFLVLCCYAYRLKLNVFIAASWMAIGMALALSPQIFELWNADLGDYGDLIRKQRTTVYSDGFYAITSYMHVGRGKIIAVIGMASGLVFYGVYCYLRKKNG